MTEGDYRYLLRTRSDDLPEYNQDLLLDIWDKLTDEFDSITKRYEFKRKREDDIDDALKINRLNGMRAAYNYALLGNKDAVDMLKEWDVIIPDVSFKSLMRVKSIIAREITAMRIDRSRTEELNKAEKSYKNDIIASMVQAENILKRSFDKEKVTVKEWIYITKSVDRIVAQRKKRK